MNRYVCSPLRASNMNLFQKENGAFVTYIQFYIQSHWSLAVPQVVALFPWAPFIILMTASAWECEWGEEGGGSEAAELRQ